MMAEMKSNSKLASAIHAAVCITNKGIRLPNRISNGRQLLADRCGTVPLSAENPIIVVDFKFLIHARGLRGTLQTGTPIAASNSTHKKVSWKLAPRRALGSAISTPSAAAPIGEHGAFAIEQTRAQIDGQHESGAPDGRANVGENAYATDKRRQHGSYEIAHIHPAQIQNTTNARMATFILKTTST